MGHVAPATRQPEAIELPLPWGPVVRGLRWGSGSDSVLLLHEPGADIDAWGTLPAQLAATLSVSAVAGDLPGHGLSDDPWQPEKIDELVRLLVGASDALPRPALAPLPPPRGSTGEGGDPSGAREEGRRLVIAAGSTAWAVLALGNTLTLAGIALLSPAPTPDLEPRTSATDPPSPTRVGKGGRGVRTAVPKLFIAGSLADNDLDAARRLASTSGGWTVVTSIPVSDRGTALLESTWRTRLEEEISGFLRDCVRPRPAAPEGYRVTRRPPR